MAKEKFDGTAAQKEKFVLEQLIKDHGYPTVRMVFNRLLNAIREIQKLSKEKRALDRKIEAEKKVLDQQFEKAQKKLK